MTPPTARERSWGSSVLGLLALLTLGGCLEGEGCSAGDDREDQRLRAQWANPYPVRVPPASGPILECPIDMLPNGITAEDLEEILRAQQPILATEEEFFELCARLKRGIDIAIEHSASDLPPADPSAMWAWIKVRAWVKTTVDLEFAEEVDAALPCGEDIERAPSAQVLCASDAPIPEGELTIVSMLMHEPLPLDEPDLYHQLAFVFSADGDASNDYQASPEYPNDFFQATDRWYEVLVDPVNGPSLSVKDARAGDIQVVASAARVVIDGALVMAVIPTSELEAPCPGYRSTAFVHEGDYGLEPPHWWSGDTEPTVHEPLEPLCEE